jgi:hypothetical protein
VNPILWLLQPILDRILHKQENLMTAIQTLTADVANLQTALSAQLAAITAKLNEALPDDPNVLAANTAIEGVTAQLNASAAALAPTPPAA